MDCFHLGPLVVDCGTDQQSNLMSTDNNTQQIKSHMFCRDKSVRLTLEICFHAMLQPQENCSVLIGKKTKIVSKLKLEFFIHLKAYFLIFYL